jgi:hypothetical protein
MNNTARDYTIECIPRKTELPFGGDPRFNHARRIIDIHSPFKQPEAKDLKCGLQCQLDPSFSSDERFDMIK